MKKLLLFALFFSPISLFAQNISISGTVFDSLNPMQAVLYATIALHDSKTDTLLGGALANENGYYKIEGVVPGEFYLKISCMGYVSKKTEVIVVPKSSASITKNITLLLDTKVLETVVVQGDNSIIQLRPDRKILQIDKAIAAGGGSIAEVLQILPEIKVEGSSVTLKDNSFTILIDGKPSGMRPDELTQLPANLLQNIEVITNPSVRYSSEGLGGVINLKMKKAKEGFNGMVQVSGGTNAKANGIVTLNYKTKKVNMFLNVWDRYEGGRTESTYKVSNTDSSYLSQNFQNKLSRNMLCSKLGLDYDINANNFLSFYWLSYYKKGKGSSLFQEQFSSPILGENKEIKKAVRDGLFDNEIALNYTYQKKRDFLTVDLTYFNQNQPNIFEYLEKDQITFSQNIDFFKSYYSASVYYSRNLATFWKIYDFKLETGLSAESDNQKINNSLSTIDNNKKKTVDYVSQKMAGFLQLSVGSPKVGINAGLKVNYFDNSVNLQDSLLDHQKFPYIISGVSIYYKPFSVLEMSIGQSSRISTPYLLQINPLFFFDEYTYTRNTGNPHLLPATTNSWEFNINYSDEKGWKAYATLGYMSTKNDFTQTYFEEEGNVLYVLG